MFRNLYKQGFNKCERQEIRRKELLLHQKLKRLEQQDGQRNCKQRLYYNEKKYKTNIESIHLQLSEWLKEKPDNLDDWLLVPCPKGQRCFVVSEKGKTKMFNKNKKFCMTFSSLIPGGGSIGSGNDYSILDCIYDKENDIFYVLDALHYIIPLIDCDAEFRFFWLESKFKELHDLKDKYDGVKSFQVLDKFDLAKDTSLATALQKHPLWVDNQPQLDGFLFYHKESHYVFGTTPLVCWLFPFMVPDILQMTVSSAYEPPPNYCNQDPWQYMNDFDKEIARRRTRIKHKELLLNLIPMEDVEIED